MIQEVRRLLGEPGPFEGGDDDLDRLFADLLGDAPRSPSYELRRVRALRHLPVALGYRPGEALYSLPEVAVIVAGQARNGSEEAAVFAGVASRPAGLDPVQQGVAVAVEADLDHPLGVTARRSL